MRNNTLDAIRETLKDCRRLGVVSVPTEVADILLARLEMAILYMHHKGTCDRYGLRSRTATIKCTCRLEETRAEVTA